MPEVASYSVKSKISPKKEKIEDFFPFKNKDSSHFNVEKFDEFIRHLIKSLFLRCCLAAASLESIGPVRMAHAAWPRASA